MLASSRAPQGLLGRRDECRVLDDLVVGVRGGRSAALVVRGDAGIGKTALLEYVQCSASDCGIAKAVGIESEMELAFGGLHQLCTPFRDHLRRLPVPQRDALETAFGLTAGTPPDRFLVGLAVLSLLADVAEERPLVCLVDDAQWLDRVSLQTLAFVARRLFAEKVGLVFAMREPVGNHELSGLRTLEVVGLGHDDAHALLDWVTPAGLDQRIRERVVAEARGNPLALLELPRGLTSADLAGGFALPQRRSVAQQVQAAFRRRVQALPAETQRLLLAAAADTVGNAPVLWRTVEILGIGPEAAAEAESAGLIELGARVRFRHPLLRAAVYRSASAQDRRAVHSALAEATDPCLDPEGRAWHRAHASSAPDEQVASELEQTAELVRARGGIAAAAAFLERATELTPDPVRRAERALGAARAKLKAGSAEAADDLLISVELGPTDGLKRARLQRLRAQVFLARGRPGEAQALLLDAANRLDALDDPSARDTYLEALGAAIFVGRLGEHGSLEGAAAAARAARPARPPSSAMDLLLDGLTTRFTDGYVAALPDLRLALDAFRREADRDRAGIMRWLWLACPVAPEPIAPDLWDDEAWHELSARAVGLAREIGALGVIPKALSYRAAVHVHAGEFAEASELLAEADRIAGDAGNAGLNYSGLMLAAWRGNEPDATKLIETSVKIATARGEGRSLGLVGYVTAVLHNGLGHYHDALDGARRACEHDDLGFYGWALAELVEAAARSNDPRVATEALKQLEDRTSAAGTEWALGILARSRALLSEGPAAEAHYREATERLERSRIAVHLGRAHLLYGEWLRRQNRRQDARTQLRTAHDMFDRFGAEGFARRARDELSATGERVRRRNATTRDLLTAQEAQIARLAGDGLTNPEIGAQLFLSRHTVEWHLRKVFAKLDISSRRQLTPTLAGATG
jgi:DNA-binding CsgD family transcriptional regulator